MTEEVKEAEEVKEVEITQIGTKIYYEKNTGNKILELGDMQGYVVDSTTEQDFENYAELKKYDKEAVGKIQLEYGEFGKLMEQHKANSYKVDITGEEPKLVFSWIDYSTGEPTERPKSEVEILQDKIKEQGERITALSNTLDEVILGQAEEIS